MGGIVWLASYPKSGNTWLRAFLHNLLLNLDEPVDINRMDVVTMGDSQLRWFEPFLNGRAPESLSDEEIMELRQKVQKGFTQSSPNAVFAKTHNLLGSFAGRPLVCPEYAAGAIYVVRNPLDVVLSLSDHAGLSIDDTITMMGDREARTYTDKANVFEIHGGWSRHVHSWTHQASPGLLVVRYEDMLANAMPTFGRITQFLGMELPKSRIRKAIEFSSFKNLSQQEKKTGFRERSTRSEKFFRVGKSGQWKKKLTKPQIDRIIADHREQMARFDYLP